MPANYETVLSRITSTQFEIIGDALQQLSDNRAEDEDGEPVYDPQLDDLLEKFDSAFANPPHSNS